MSAGLVASTVTPGSTAPEGSLTTPLIAACAAATTGSNSANPKIATVLPVLSTVTPHRVCMVCFLGLPPERGPTCYTRPVPMSNVRRRAECWYERVLVDCCGTDTAHHAYSVVVGRMCERTEKGTDRRLS